MTPNFPPLLTPSFPRLVPPTILLHVFPIPVRDVSKFFSLLGLGRVILILGNTRTRANKEPEYYYKVKKLNTIIDNKSILTKTNIPTLLHLILDTPPYG